MIVLLKAVSNGFYHKDIILSLRKHFVKEFVRYVAPVLQNSISWEFPDLDFSHAYTSGLGDKQVKIINTEFIIGKKKVPIDFIEDYQGNLTVVVNSKSVYLLKPMEGLSTDFIKTLAKSIRGAL
jgi:hypothetical protein